MWRDRKAYQQQRKAAIAFQCGWRAKRARGELKQLKTEARSVAGIQARNSGLAKKVIELQQTMDRRVREAEEKQATAMETLQAQLNAVTATGTQASQSSAEEMKLLREENVRLQAELETATQTRDSHAADLATLRTESAESIAALQAEVTHGVLVTWTGQLICLISRRSNFKRKLSKLRKPRPAWKKPNRSSKTSV